MVSFSGHLLVIYGVGVIDENQHALPNVSPSMGNILCICKCFIKLCVLEMSASYLYGIYVYTFLYLGLDQGPKLS